MPSPKAKSEFGRQNTNVASWLAMQGWETGGPLEFTRAFSYVLLRELTPPKSVSPDLALLIAGFLDWARVERGFSQETISTYRRSLERFVTEGSVFSIENLRSDDVLHVKRSLMNRGCSPAYIAAIILAVRSFLRYCGDVLELTVIDPQAVKPPRRPRRQVSYLTADDVRRFVESIKLENRWIGKRRGRAMNQQGLLYRAVVEVLLGTGMRISEALAIRR